ncbi:hypothetical protein HK102_005640 [Quaeritorhiza haematococci]|nr:hypothetical protein HK102_005640 [Quaeritorhiza haematococci]
MDTLANQIHHLSNALLLEASTSPRNSAHQSASLFLSPPEPTSLPSGRKIDAGLFTFRVPHGWQVYRAAVPVLDHGTIEHINVLRLDGDPNQTSFCLLPPVDFVVVPTQTQQLGSSVAQLDRWLETLVDKVHGSDLVELARSRPNMANFAATLRNPTMASSKAKKSMLPSDDIDTAMTSTTTSNSSMSPFIASAVDGSTPLGTLVSAVSFVLKVQSSPAHQPSQTSDTMNATNDTAKAVLFGEPGHGHYRFYIAALMDNKVQLVVYSSFGLIAFAKNLGTLHSMLCRATLKGQPDIFELEQQLLQQQEKEERQSNKSEHEEWQEQGAVQHTPPRVSSKNYTPPDYDTNTKRPVPAPADIHQQALSQSQPEIPNLPQFPTPPGRASTIMVPPRVTSTIPLASSTPTVSTATDEKTYVHAIPTGGSAQAVGQSQQLALSTEGPRRASTLGIPTAIITPLNVMVDAVKAPASAPITSSSPPELPPPEFPHPGPKITPVPLDPEAIKRRNELLVRKTQIILNHILSTKNIPTAPIHESLFQGRFRFAAPTGWVRIVLPEDGEDDKQDLVGKMIAIKPAVGAATTTFILGPPHPIGAESTSTPDAAASDVLADLVANAHTGMTQMTKTTPQNLVSPSLTSCGASAITQNFVLRHAGRTHYRVYALVKVAGEVQSAMYYTNGMVTFAKHLQEFNQMLRGAQFVGDVGGGSAVGAGLGWGRKTLVGAGAGTGSSDVASNQLGVPLPAVPEFPAVPTLSRKSLSRPSLSSLKIDGLSASGGERPAILSTSLTATPTAMATAAAGAPTTPKSPAPVVIPPRGSSSPIVSPTSPTSGQPAPISYPATTAAAVTTSMLPMSPISPTSPTSPASPYAFPGIPPRKSSSAAIFQPPSSPPLSASQPPTRPLFGITHRPATLEGLFLGSGMGASRVNPVTGKMENPWVSVTLVLTHEGQGVYGGLPEGGRLSRFFFEEWWEKCGKDGGAVDTAAPEGKTEEADTRADTTGGATASATTAMSMPDLYGRYTLEDDADSLVITWDPRIPILDVSSSSSSPAGSTTSLNTSSNQTPLSPQQQQQHMSSHVSYPCSNPTHANVIDDDTLVFPRAAFHTLMDLRLLRARPFPFSLPSSTTGSTTMGSHCLEGKYVMERTVGRATGGYLQFWPDGRVVVTEPSVLARFNREGSASTSGGFGGGGMMMGMSGTWRYKLWHFTLAISMPRGGETREFTVYVPGTEDVESGDLFVMDGVTFVKKKR